MSEPYNPDGLVKVPTINSGQSGAVMIMRLFEAYEWKSRFRNQGAWLSGPDWNWPVVAAKDWVPPNIKLTEPIRIHGMRRLDPSEVPEAVRRMFGEEALRNLT